MSEYKRHILGSNGEKIACKYLESMNYIIICKNFRCRQGEIDIIARDKNEIVFVEVKTRTNKIYGNPIDAVNWIKQNHIYKASEYFLYSNRLENVSIRYDVIEIYKDAKYYINHIKNVDIINKRN